MIKLCIFINIQKLFGTIAICDPVP